MKKISALLIIASVIFSNSAFAKKAAQKNEPQKEAIVESIDSIYPIQNFDIQKLFEEADKVHKLAKAWKKIKCEPKTGFVCTKRECVQREISTSLILDKKKDLITRCDKQGNCESFEADFKQVGVFFNIQTEGPIGTLIRVFGDSRYKEITTVGLDAYIVNGECVVVDEDK